MLMLCMLGVLWHGEPMGWTVGIVLCVLIGLVFPNQVQVGWPIKPILKEISYE